MLEKFISKHLSEPKGIGGRIVFYFMNRQNRPIYEKVADVLALSDNEKVLDIGCGNGIVLNLLAKKHDCQFTGIDISESIISAAKQRNKRYVASGKIHFDCQNINAMNFADGTFDKVYTINTVYFWDSLDVAMCEIRRVLKDDGVFFNTMFSNETLDRFSFTKHGYKKYTQQQLTKAGTDTGFDVEVVPFFKSLAYCYIYRKREG